jgi:hypothetical protein
MAELKPGIKTTEFWLTSLVSFLYGLIVLVVSDIPKEAFILTITPVITYIYRRIKHKDAVAQNANKG